MKALAAATALLDTGDAPAALARATDALAILDVDDEAEAVVCLIVIGRCHQALADHAAARDSLDQAHQRAVGFGEPRTVVVALGALATQDRVEGYWAHAEQRLTAALAAAAQCDGHDGDLVAWLRNELAITFKQLGRFDEAANLYRQALDTLEQRHGPDHPDVAAILHNLAGLAHARGDLATAARLARRGLATRLAACGEDHLAVAADCAALAPILDALGDTDEAEQLLRRALAVFERVFGPDHYEVAVILHNLGAIEHRRRRLTQAAALYRRSLHTRAAVLGDHHPELATTLINLGVVERARGRTRTAKRALHNAVRLLETVVGPDHPTLLAARAEFAALQPSATHGPPPHPRPYKPRRSGDPAPGKWLSLTNLSGDEAPENHS